MLLVAEGIARGGALYTDRRSDVTGIDHIEVFAVIGVHLQDSSEALAGLLRGVENGGSLRHGAGVHAEEAELTDKGIRGDLERQRRKRRGVVRRTEDFFLGVRIGAVDALFVERGRQIIHNGVKQLLHALVLVRRTADHRDHANADGCFADGCTDLLLRDVLAGKIQLHDRVILVGHGFEQLFAVFLCEIGKILGNFFLTDILAKLVIEHIGLHFHKVNNALEVRFRTDGELERHCVTLQPLMHHFENIEEVRTHDVHFIHIDHPRHVVLVGLTPDGLRLRLHTALGTKHGHGAVQHAQGTLDLNGEIDVTRRVDDIDAAMTPEAGRRSGSDRDAALLLLLHPVHSCGTLMRLTELVGAAGVEQDTLRRGGLAGVDVRHDTDVSCILK